MYYQEDWLLRQINAVINTLAVLFTGKKLTSESIKDIESQISYSEYYKKISKLVEIGDINKAENLLFSVLENMEKEEQSEIPLLALLFYYKLNELSDEELDKKNFSRKEIMEGIESVKKLFI